MELIQLCAIIILTVRRILSSSTSTENDLLTPLVDDRSAGSAEGEAPKKRKAPAGKGRGKGAASNKVKLEDEADEDEAEI